MYRFLLPTLIISLLAACAPFQLIQPQPAATFSPGDQSSVSPPQEPGPIIPGAENPYSPQVNDNLLQRGRVALESKDLLVQESFPPRYILVLKGTLPTPCHKLRVEIDGPDTANRLKLEIYSVIDPGVVCVQTVAPFDAQIGLNSYPAGKYSIWVNGEKVGDMEVPEASLAMKGYELYSWQSEGNWRFSLLMGTNRLKSIEEIMEADERLEGIDSLKQALARLPQGEQIFWIIRDIPGFSFPPGEVVDDIRAYCDQLGLQLDVEDYLP